VSSSSKAPSGDVARPSGCCAVAGTGRRGRCVLAQLFGPDDRRVPVSSGLASSYPIDRRVGHGALHRPEPRVAAWRPYGSGDLLDTGRMPVRRRRDDALSSFSWTALARGWPCRHATMAVLFSGWGWGWVLQIWNMDSGNAMELLGPHIHYKSN
jgi:hypothetical protein